MKNSRKTNIVIAIAVLSILCIFINGGLKNKDNIYVVSDVENTKEKETINKEEATKQVNAEDKDSDKIQKNKNVDLREIRIFISGEVKNPGVVTIQSDKRLIDAVDMLGGFTDEANLNSINLASSIEDEKHYIIPKIGEVQNELASEDANNNESMNTNQSESSSKININTATIEQLEKIPGVGEATANKILSYREENKKFNTIEEIKNVNGIGDKKYDDMKDMIVVE